MEVFQQTTIRIMRSVLTALYQPFWGAVSMAFLFMFLFLYGKEKGWGISDCFPKMIRKGQTTRLSLNPFLVHT